MNQQQFQYVKNQLGQHLAIGMPSKQETTSSLQKEAPNGSKEYFFSQLCI